MPNGHAYDPVPIEEHDRQVRHALDHGRAALVGHARAMLEDVRQRCGNVGDAAFIVEVIGTGPLADRVLELLAARKVQRERERAEGATRTAALLRTFTEEG